LQQGRLPCSSASTLATVLEEATGEDAAEQSCKRNSGCHARIQVEASRYDFCRIYDRVACLGEDATLAWTRHAALHANEAVFAPVRSPGVLDQPVVNPTVSSVTDEEDTMVDFVAKAMTLAWIATATG